MVFIRRDIDFLISNELPDEDMFPACMKRTKWPTQMWTLFVRSHDVYCVEVLAEPH